MSAPIRHARNLVPSPAFVDLDIGSRVVDAASLMGGVKTCPGCGYIKPTSAFQANASKPDRMQSRCRACCARKRERVFVLKHVEKERDAARSRAAAFVTEKRRYVGVRGGLLLAGYIAVLAFAMACGGVDDPTPQDDAGADVDAAPFDCFAKAACP